jgi:hypothetical protein
VFPRRVLPAVAAAMSLPMLLLASYGCGAAAASAAGSEPVRLVAASRAGASPTAWSRLCAARPTPAITRALKQHIPRSLGELWIDAISPDGRLLYVNVRGELSAAGEAGFRGLEVVNDRTWKVLARLSLPARPDWAGPALTAGPWFVWIEYYSDTNLDKFTVHAWNTVTGQVRKIGSSVPGWSSPFQSPAYSGNYAAWVAGDGPGPVDKVVLANLRTGRERVVYQGHGHGHALEPFFDGDLLVWPQSAVAQGTTTLTGVNVRTGKPAVLPAALRGVHAWNTIVTAGQQTAYILGPDYDKLYYSPSPSQPAKVVLRTPLGTLEDVELGTGWLAFTGSATYLASTRTGVYVQVTPEFGDASGNGSDMVAIGDYAGKKAVTPPPHLLDVSKLAWPHC